MFKTKNSKKSDIQRFYTRTRQGKYGNSYYLEPSEMCPLDVLKDKRRFVILTFDKADDYVVISGRRYYLNRWNSLKCTDKEQRRVAVVDIKALKESKDYPYDSKYRHKHTLEVDSFSILEAEAERQYSYNGLPYVRQIARYDKKANVCSYVYEPSFQAA